MSGNVATILVSIDEENPDIEIRRAKSRRQFRKQLLLWSICGYFSPLFAFTFCLAIALCVLLMSTPSTRNGQLFHRSTWLWCVLMVAVLTGPILSQITTKCIILLIKQVLPCKRNVRIYVLEFVERAWILAWSLMTMFAWLILVHYSQEGFKWKHNYKFLPKQIEPIILSTFITFLATSCLLVIKDLVLTKMGSSFNEKYYFDRMKKAWIYHHKLASLSGVPENQHFTSELDATNYDDQEKSKLMNNVYIGLNQMRHLDHQERLEASQLFEWNQTNVPDWGVQILISELTKKYKRFKLVCMSQDDESRRKMIQSEKDAKDFGRSVFNNLVSEGEESTSNRKDKSKTLIDWLSRETDNMPMNNAEDVAHCMAKIFNYHDTVVRGITNNKCLFEALNIYANVVLAFAMFSLWLVIFSPATAQIIVIIGSAVIASQLTGNAVQRMLKNFAFIFVIHPYDVGDYCLIDGTPVIIEEIYINTTVATNAQSRRQHYPNAFLSSQSISNYTRSPPEMPDSLVFYLHMDSSLEKLKHVEEKFHSYILSNQNHWHPEHNWVVKLDDDNKLKVTLQFHHRIDCHEFKERQEREIKLLSELKNDFHDEGLWFHGSKD